MRGSLEEDVARFDVGEEQAVRIACDGRTLDLLDLGGFLVKRYVERQRTVDDDVTQLSAIAHLGEQSGFGRGEHARQQLLRRCDAGDLRRLDTDQVGDARQVADQDGFLFEVGLRNHRYVRDDQQLGIVRHFDYRYVAQRAFRGEQTCVLVQDAAHVLVRGNQTLHQYVGLARNDGIDSQIDALHVVALGDYFENVAIDILFLANLLDDLGIAEQNRLYQTFLISCIDGCQRVGVLTVSDCKALLTFFSCLFDNFTQMLHGLCVFNIIVWLFIDDFVSVGGDDQLLVGRNDGHLDLRIRCGNDLVFAAKTFVDLPVEVHAHKFEAFADLLAGFG